MISASLAAMSPAMLIETPNAPRCAGPYAGHGGFSGMCGKQRASTRGALMLVPMSMNGLG